MYDTYETILSAGLHARFEQEIRRRPSLVTPPDLPPEPATPLASGSLWDEPAQPNPLSPSNDTTLVSTPERPSTPVDKVETPLKDAEENETRTMRMATSDQLSHAMATIARPHLWISLWFLVTIPVIFWDAGYCFMRPRSMSGGDLHWIWTPYALYQNIDYVYGLPALQRGDGFPNAQSLLNVIENFMNIYYLYLAHYAQSPAAPVLGFASATMTLSKTFLYGAQEFYCGGCSVGHNDLNTLLVYWVLPNGLWLVVPSLIVYQLGKDISSSLRVANTVAKKQASGKKQ